MRLLGNEPLICVTAKEAFVRGRTRFYYVSLTSQILATNHCLSRFPLPAFLADLPNMESEFIDTLIHEINCVLLDWITDLSTSKKYTSTQLEGNVIEWSEEEDHTVRDDGSVLTGKRINPKLIPDAYPSIFPNQPAYLSSDPVRKEKFHLNKEMKY
ncbi:hypothetical protein CEXT_708421 [Caerostris extrusa]|uniref:Uncharacterized protein n=1 Tax=Caerostris extrusa TaxID=172846 RepID=A0AAV4T055_CAEEX|nr:hypothetical protein CEXT_708421 [Caerostris extrusa]